MNIHFKGNILDYKIRMSSIWTIDCCQLSGIRTTNNPKHGTSQVKHICNKLWPKGCQFTNSAKGFVAFFPCRIVPYQFLTETVFPFLYLKLYEASDTHMRFFPLSVLYKEFL